MWYYVELRRKQQNDTSGIVFGVVPKGMRAVLDICMRKNPLKREGFSVFSCANVGRFILFH